MENTGNMGNTKKSYRKVEDQLENAETVYKRVKEEMAQGIVDTIKISHAMGMLNGAHMRAIKENKRHLLQ